MGSCDRLPAGRRRDLPALVRHDPRGGGPGDPARRRGRPGGPDDPRLRHGRSGRRPALHARRGRVRPRRARSRRADPAGRADDRQRCHPAPPARGQRSRVHAFGPKRSFAGRADGHDALGGGTGTVARQADWLGRGDRQRADRALPPAGAPRRWRRRARGDHRRAGRVRRRRRVQSGAREAGAGAVPRGARAARRQRDGRRRDQRPRERRRMTGTLYGVGLGPGDPELMTVKAARLISEASVIAYHCARHGRSIARSVAEPYLREGQIEEKLVYPVTTETPAHPGGGRDVVLLCEGDPFFYGSYMYMHERLSGRFDAVVVPGVTAVSAASSVLGRPLVRRDEVLTVLPGTLPAPELARWLVVFVVVV